MSRQQSGQPRPDHHAYRAGRAESGQRRGASLRLDVIGHQCRRAGRHRGVETAGEAAQENDTGEGEQGRQRPVQGEHDEQAERAVGEGRSRPARRAVSAVAHAGRWRCPRAAPRASRRCRRRSPRRRPARAPGRACGRAGRPGRRRTSPRGCRRKSRTSADAGPGCWRRAAGWSSQGSFGFAAGAARPSRPAPAECPGRARRAGRRGRRRAAPRAARRGRAGPVAGPAEDHPETAPHALPSVARLPSGSSARRFSNGVLRRPSQR